MKSFVILFAVLFLETVHCKNAWELGEDQNAWELGKETLRMRELRDREEQAAKTTIVAYDKLEMSQDQIDAEKKRLKGACDCDLQDLEEAGVFILTYKSTAHPGIDSLGLDPSKEVAADDQVVETYSSPPPTDPFLWAQWPLQDLANNADINIAEGWKEYLSDSQGASADGPSVIVGVIDSGVDYTHPDLKDVMWTNPKELANPSDGVDNDGNGIIDDVYGADFTTSSSGTGNPMDKNGHGTHCAGVIRAKENNGKGIAGVASFTQSKVKIMACKGLSDTGVSTASSLLGCFNYVIKMGAKISSNSWGSKYPSQINPYANTERVWDSVLRNNPDHLFVAAAGNDNQFIYDGFKPMACGLKEANVLCVASSTADGQLSGFSNYGKDYVHVVAPGSAIASTVPNGGYARMSGTSMACPHVSGLAALVRSMRGNLTGRQVRELIEANVQKKSIYADKVSTGGLIDVGATIKALKSGSVPAPDPAKTCKTIKIRTENYGNENSYVIGSCTSEKIYDKYSDYTENCCLTPGLYTLKCKDTYKDGWHGGYLEIDGTQYCKDFTSGSLKTALVTF